MSRALVSAMLMAFAALCASIFGLLLYAGVSSRDAVITCVFALAVLDLYVRFASAK